MASGGMQKMRQAGGDARLSIDVIGRNFSTPTQFNQAHKYKTVQEFVEAFLIVELPPVATIAGHFRLNGSAAFVPFATIERGTIVNEVRITVTGKSQVNSPDLAEIMIGGGAAPASTLVAAGVRDSTVLGYDVALLLNTPKAYTSRAKDVKGILSTQLSSTWATGIKAYFGKGNVEGVAITEAWVRANLTKNATYNQHMASVTVTPGADDYILYLAPVAWGLRVFEFLGSDQTNPESATRLKIRTDAEIANGITQNDATEYFVVRSLGKGLGGGAPYTFNIGTIG